jgi:hypothetical protein
MLDFGGRNKPRAYFACLALLASCDNPGLERDPIQTRSGTAGSAAMQPAVGTESSAGIATTRRTPESSRAVTDASFVHLPTTACAGATLPPTGCAGRMAGVYGIATELDVYWSDEVNPSAPAYDPGRGKLSTLLLAELNGLCPGDDEGELIVRVCDVSLPPIYIESNRGTIQLYIPATTWERQSMPEYRVHVRSSGSDPTAFWIDPITAMLGIELASADAPWPSYTETPFVSCAGGHEGAGCFPDQDEDGEPGIRVEVQLDGQPPEAAGRQGRNWSYTPVPTDLGLPYPGTGATTLFAGLRTQFGGAYPVGSDCNGGTSAADGGDVALRVLDCTTLGGTRCTPSAASVVDQNMPVFHALAAGQAPPRAWAHPRSQEDSALDRSSSVGAQNTLLRLGDLGLGAALGCEDVREIFASRRGK